MEGRREWKGVNEDLIVWEGTVYRKKQKLLSRWHLNCACKREHRNGGIFSWVPLLNSNSLHLRVCRVISYELGGARRRREWRSFLSQLSAALLCSDLLFTLVYFLAIPKGSDKLGFASRFHKFLDLGCQPHTLFSIWPPADPVFISAVSGLDPFFIHRLYVFQKDLREGGASCSIIVFVWSVVISLVWNILYLLLQLVCEGFSQFFALEVKIFLTSLLSGCSPVDGEELKLYMGHSHYVQLFFHFNGIVQLMVMRHLSVWILPDNRKEAGGSVREGRKWTGVGRTSMGN